MYAMQRTFQANSPIHAQAPPHRFVHAYKICTSAGKPRNTKTSGKLMFASRASLRVLCAGRFAFIGSRKSELGSVGVK